MMSLSRIAFKVIALHLISFSAFRAQQPHDQDYDRIYKVNVGDDNYLYINVTNNNGSVNFAGTGCSGPYFARSKYTLSDDRTRAWLQISLSSLLSRQGVHVWTAGCDGGYPIFTQLQLQAP
jgi:hypothetical protein